MNPNSSSTWPAAVSGEDDEFTSFLEFSNLDIDFGSFDPVEHHDGHVQTAHQALVENMHRDGALGLNSGELENQGDNMEIQMPLDPQLRKDSHMEGTDISHTSHHDFSLQASHSKVYHRPGGVPPTPNSLEIHGAQYQSFHRADPHANPIYDAYHGKQDQVCHSHLLLTDSPF